MSSSNQAEHRGLEIAEIESGRLFEASQHLDEATFQLRTLEVTILFAGSFLSNELRDHIWVVSAPVLLLLAFDFHLARWAECLRQSQLEIFRAIVDKKDEHEIIKMVTRTDIGSRRTWTRWLQSKKAAIIFAWHLSVLFALALVVNLVDEKIDCKTLVLGTILLCVGIRIAFVGDPVPPTGETGETGGR